MEDHGIEEEFAMCSMGASDDLVNIVLHGPGSEGHSTVDGQADLDRDEGMGGGFLLGKEQGSS